MRKSHFLTSVWLAASCFSIAHAHASAPPPADDPQMQPPRTRAEVESHVKARFAALDANKDGFITPDELQGGHRGPGRAGATATEGQRPGPGASKDRADQIFARIDTDRNGQVSKAEFEAFAAAHRPTQRWAGGRDRAAWGGPHGEMRGMHAHRERMARWMFEREDADHDGKVSLAEAEKAALDRFDRIDTNHDGTISDAERAAAHQQMAARFHEEHGRRWRGPDRDGWGHHGDAASPPTATPQG